RLARPGTIDGFAPGDRAILADIDNATADSTLGRAVLVAASVGFQQSARIELLPRGQVLRSLQAGRSTEGDTLITADLALEVAAREAVPWVVAIRIETDRARNRVTTRLLRSGTGEVAHTSGRWADGGLALVEAVGETIRRLLERLGEPARALREQPALEFATTSSLDALRAYAEGSAAWSLGSYQLAGDYWRRAIALDTGFAMAMGSLGGYYYYHHDRAQGERYYGEALARRGRLTEWERLQIEERYAGWRGDRDSALALGRLIVARFPRAQTYYSLGTQLLQMDRCPEALESLERARELDPRSVPAHINVATCRKRLGQYEEARQAYLAAGRLDSTALYRGNINLEYAGAALLAGHPLEAESALIRMTRRSGMTDQALGYRGLGFLAFWRGEVFRAREHFLRAAGYSREQRAANSLLRNLLLVAAMARAGGDEAAVPPLLRQIDSLAALPSMAPAFLGLAAEAYAEDRDAARLRRLLEMTRAGADPRLRDDSLLVHYVAGAVALAAGDPRTALAAFDRAAGNRHPAALGLRRAQAWEQLGELDSARAELARIVDRVRFGFEDQIAWTQALIAIGRVEERAGRFDDAIASYRRFLAHWKDGDPGLPGVVRVRGRLDALRDRAGSATRAAPAEQEPDPAPSRPQRVMTRMGGSL
ncbi:MAG TPA: tetratricopeptide repeat protein, partial [Gemmatimonadales bacterium]|nr:tetratricopeptide repeat protein [Gemmatimonadales bacterium]